MGSSATMLGDRHSTRQAEEIMAGTSSGQQSKQFAILENSFIKQTLEQQQVE